MLRSKINSRIIFFGVLILLMFAYGCTDANVETPADTTPAPPAETTPTETAPTQTTPNETTTSESPYPFPDIEPMPDELREKVEKAFVEKHNYLDSFPGWRSSNNMGRIRYYGMFGNAVIIFDRGEISVTESTTIKVADSSFYYGSAFALYVFYEENLIDLKDAYEQNIVSAEDVAIAAQRHEAYNQYDSWINNN